ncbi:methyltransferase-like protein 17, mitochondrial [Vespa velutina]|uniref:methyltransferase-like protein 17, mitochondrial n=1 Tax=Vespa velutina TaxID=202808 RepID=UPI001FB41A1C|nr:methyltransferase-like protein 17, mitochondrial [Vespa velutina]XP_047356105.1 methyltransferase-like protein 17, mitochondrial [Vespa velutina]XP_047356106.1 methyltransferase-like protein 17, mitochondrial [Vespa velutina]
MMLNLYFLRRMQVRNFSVKVEVKLNDSTNTLIENKLLKHRHHPGIVKPRVVEVPDWIKNSIQIVLKDSKIPTSYLWEGGQKLMKHLLGRFIPDIQRNLQNKKTRSQATMYSSNLNERNEDIIEYNMKNNSTLVEEKQQLHNSAITINYNRRTGLLYIVGRSQYEYCAVYKVLNQIKSKNVNFKPQTLFDFGSGIGTVMWAASQLWSDSLKEYFGVDSSSEMNDLSEELNKYNTHPIKNIFYRQFLPALPVPTYDIVVSSFSLLELPNTKARFDVIQKLWAKVQNYLVIIEDGTNAGFTAVNEARDIILYNILKSDKSNNNNCAHVFAPCPHDMKCPRYYTDDIPCNFEISYYTLPLSGPSFLKKQRYSYVILKKGVRSDSDNQWPRIVQPTLKRSKHVICRTCTANGTLKEIIFTSYKYGKNAYRCARVSQWGDLLPIEISKDKVT